ncbi:MAG: hypothetical protein IKH41_05090 [Clostridia bacterium]|nr:hypothetical protein [Clostridia bacterium]
MKVQDTIKLAKKHSIRRDVASPDFFEGAIMGNGDLGLIVCTRPDALLMHLGHNNIWDIRIDESQKDKVGTFKEIWGKIINDKEDFGSRQWFADYCREVTASYHDHVYPRPFPASDIYLFFDRKGYEVLGHDLDISNGLLTINLESGEGKRLYIKIAVSMKGDDIVIRTVNDLGEPANIFYRIMIVPYISDDGLPKFIPLENGFRQLLTYNGYEGTARPGIDKGFSLLYRLNGKTVPAGLDKCFKDLDEGVTDLSFSVTEGYYDRVEKVKEAPVCVFDDIADYNANIWAEYWQQSGIKIDDEFLEHLWYINTYFIRCVLNSHSRCPGLFGNWMCPGVGTAWHGDYHMNYNTQQVFWGLMGANRQELHFPYLRLVEDLLPVSAAWANDFYSLEGACFPHSAYPVPMTINPYPSPDWGWEIFETPWTVQSLWWHYTYTKDIDLLRTRIYPLIRAASAFLVGYMMREGADPVGDGKYHLFPTVVPELYGLSGGLTKNLDGTTDLAFTKFIFNATLEAISDLGLGDAEAELAANMRKILAAFPDYPTAAGRFGEVYVSVGTEDPDHVIYNTPANLMPIFPGEDVDALSASGEALEIAKRSWLHHYNEGGNDLVFYHLIGARLGIIDIEKFKRHVRYCMMPNQYANLRATLTGGRYVDTSGMDFMMRAGLFTENLSLYAVVDECLIWGHTDTIVLFPNWDKKRPAEFCSLRTKGAFLVDAACSDGDVTYVKITGERGGVAKLKNPWRKAVDQRGKVYETDIVTVMIAPGESVEFTPAE